MPKNNQIYYFKIALAIHGITMSNFARNHGYSPQALDRYLKGKTVSNKINTDVCTFISNTLSNFNQDI
jgi:hypothetical protein